MEHFFDIAASKWDTPERVERAEKLAVALREKLGNVKEQAALEIGCGTGLLSLCMAADFKKISSMDTSSKMIEVLKTKINKAGVGNVSVIKEELEDIVKRNIRYDVIFSSMVFHHIIDLESELQMLRRLLKPHGRIAIIDLDEDNGRFHENEPDFHGHNGFDRNLFVEMIEQNGFQNTEIKTIYSGEKVLEKGCLAYTLFLCTAEVI